MKTNTCNHTEEIARAIYLQYQTSLNPHTDFDWASLPADERQAWLRIAGTILPTLGHHALADLLAYAKLKLRETSSGWRKLLWGLAASALLAALSWLASMGLTGCGHTVEASREEGILICKDGSCLIVKDGRITYRPHPQQPITPSGK